MISNPEWTVDINPPSFLLAFFSIHGVFAVLVNILGVILIMKNPRILRLYRGFLLNMQIISSIADAHITIFMQPSFLFPLPGVSTNGLLWNIFRMPSHLQVCMFVLFLYLQIASIVCAIVTKFQVVSSIGNSRNRSSLFWAFVVFYHSFPFLICFLFTLCGLTRSNEEILIRTKYPNATNVLSLENMSIYDIQENKWLVVTFILVSMMLISSILISAFFSFRLLKTLRSKRKIISSRSYRGHKIAVTSLMAQATVPFLVIILPIGSLVYFFIRTVPNVQLVANAMMGIYSLHSTLSTGVMIISTPQYRKMLKKGLRGAPTAGASPNMTRVFPQSASSDLRTKKLSTPCS